MHRALLALALGACSRDPRPPPKPEIPLVEVDHLPMGTELFEPMRVHGTVDPGSIYPREHWFKLAGNGWKLRVSYADPLPATFHDGVDCVVTGRMHKVEYNELELRASEIAVNLPAASAPARD